MGSSTEASFPTLDQTNMTDFAVSPSGAVHQNQPFDLVGSPTQALDFWNALSVDGFPAWPLNDGFVLDATEMQPTATNGHNAQIHDHDFTENGVISGEPSPSEFDLPPPVLDLAKIWVTNLQSNDDPSLLSRKASPRMTPLPYTGDITDVDDHYRLRLSKVLLTPPPQQDPLPSSDFLVRHIFRPAPEHRLMIVPEPLCADVLFSV